VDNAFNQLEVNAFLKDVVRGCILIAAVAAYARRTVRHGEHVS
jgi:ribose transport system permease protein